MTDFSNLPYETSYVTHVQPEVQLRQNLRKGFEGNMLAARDLAHEEVVLF